MVLDRLDKPGAARARAGRFDSPQHKEDFIQRLIYYSPQLLPVRATRSGAHFARLIIAGVRQWCSALRAEGEAAKAH
jgi:hypothetical protein